MLSNILKSKQVESAKAKGKAEAKSVKVLSFY